METKTWALASYPTPPSAMANRPFAAHALWSRMCWNRLKAAWRGRQSLKWRYAVTSDAIAKSLSAWLMRRPPLMRPDWFSRMVAS